MRRVSVVGCPGAGKSTVGRHIARAVGAPFLELDSVFHQPGWTELPAEPFRKRVADFVSGETWVVDGNYSVVQDIVWERADTVVWLDLPRPVVMRRVVLRTLRRAATRQELWNGNREPLTNFYRLEPERNIIRWAWLKHAAYVARYEAAMADPANAHLGFVRLRSPIDVTAFVASVRPAGP